jgi:hypothetical protein
MTAAVAHSFDDEPQPDSAEAEMPAADFRIIERAHEICDHSAAVDLDEAAKHDHGRVLKLEQHATKILGAQIRALALSAKATENIQNSYKHAADVLDDFGDDEPDEPSVDWAQIAADAWAGASWTKAAEHYHATRGKQRGVRP